MLTCFNKSSSQLIVKGAIILFSVYFDSVKDQLPEWRAKIFGRKR